jgi:hypothetical protein
LRTSNVNSDIFYQDPDPDLEPNVMPKPDPGKKIIMDPPHCRTGLLANTYCPMSRGGGNERGKNERKLLGKVGKAKGKKIMEV